MIYKDFVIAIDFNNGTYYKPIAFVKADTNSSRILFNVTQDLADLRLFVNFELSDGTVYIEEATILTTNTASLVLPSGVLSVAGMVQCQAALHNLTGRLTNAVAFYYTVTKDLAEGAIEASDNLPILTQLIADCETIKDAEALRVVAETSRVDEENLRKQGETNRNNQYALAETARDGLYSSAESERDGLYATAESNRDSQFSESEQVRSAHIADKNNPHVVTKAQVGLGNADNTSDANKPISTATQTALDNIIQRLSNLEALNIFTVKS